MGSAPPNEMENDLHVGEASDLLLAAIPENKTSLQDCVQSVFGTEKVKLKCVQCGGAGNREFEKCKRLANEDPPPVIYLLLLREGPHGIKTTNVDGLSDPVAIPREQGGDVLYRASSFVLHAGNAASGHYTIRVPDAVDNYSERQAMGACPAESGVPSGAGWVIDGNDSVRMPKTLKSSTKVCLIALRLASGETVPGSKSDEEGSSEPGSDGTGSDDDAQPHGSSASASAPAERRLTPALPPPPPSAADSDCDQRKALLDLHLHGLLPPALVGIVDEYANPRMQARMVRKALDALKTMKERDTEEREKDRVDRNGRTGPQFLASVVARQIELPVAALKNFHSKEPLQQWHGSGKSLEDNVSFFFHGTSKTAVAGIVASGGVLLNLNMNGNAHGTQPPLPLPLAPAPATDRPMPNPRIAHTTNLNRLSSQGLEYTRHLLLGVGCTLQGRSPSSTAQRRPLCWCSRVSWGSTAPRGGLTHALARLWWSMMSLLIPCWSFEMPMICPRTASCTGIIRLYCPCWNLLQIFS